MTDAELAALESGSHRIGIFFRMETDPIIRLWMGFGSIEPGVNAYDGTGETYTGLGELIDVPAGKQLLNGRAERVEFTVGGFTEGAFYQIASGGDPTQVKGKKVSVGRGIFGGDWQLLGPVAWRRSYRADFLSLNQSMPENATDNPTRTITLSCGSMTTGRWRPGLSYFSNQDQQARSPGDRFCERVPLYANGFQKTWPVY